MENVGQISWRNLKFSIKENNSKMVFRFAGIKISESEQIQAIALKQEHRCAKPFLGIFVKWRKEVIADEVKDFYKSGTFRLQEIQTSKVFHLQVLKYIIKNLAYRHLKIKNAILFFFNLKRGE